MGGNPSGKAMVQKGGDGDARSQQMGKNEQVADDKEGNNKKSLGRKLIREGFLKYEVDSIAAEEVRVKKLVKSFGGYVSDQKLQKGRYREEMKVSLRVPAEDFQTLVEQVSKGVNGLDDKSVEVKDVTRKFIDLEARLKTKKELEARYKEHLKEADSIDDVLRIEKELQKLRKKIETIEGKLRHLKDRISLSTLELEFYKKIDRKGDMDEGFVFWEKVSAAAKVGWRGVQWFIVGLVGIWPILLLGSIGTWVGIRLYKKSG